jgi:class 3 adenylate cyclase
MTGETGSGMFSLLRRRLPRIPSKWTRRYVADIIDRGNLRIEALNDRISGITAGRVMPDLEQVTIGSGRRFDLSILFLDICGFSGRANWTAEEQHQVLVVMNIFMAEMLNIVRDFGGTYEKNTGDGLMAYFGEACASTAERVKPAVEAAVVMHYVNDNLISPWFQRHRIEPVRFRIGIDVGPVTIARVGLRGAESSVVAIGTTANLASKLNEPYTGRRYLHRARGLPESARRLVEVLSSVRRAKRFCVRGDTAAIPCVGIESPAVAAGRVRCVRGRLRRLT